MNYNQKQVFDIPMANNTIDLLFFLIESYATKNQIEDIDLTKYFALSGKAAKVLQGGSVTSVNSITLVTNQQKIYNIIAIIVDDIDSKETLKFKNKITIENSNFFIEIHNLLDVLNITSIDGVIVQQLTEIPEKLLV
ncbi:hypothetical protein [Flavobacterium sp.]|uniref:hypothetical protein n=1 Tax=Flavobacterium sp. TaxID=239 RepID=UPI00260BE388|nr:hypothetical protein [Flavobacterium sp.]